MSAPPDPTPTAAPPARPDGTTATGPGQPPGDDRRAGEADTAPHTADPGLPPPAVPGYEIVGELGRGGMGVVYQARQVALNRPVALKVILAGGHASAADRIRFLHEAEAEAALDHPGVVRVYEVGQHDGRPYMALEYLPGGTLTQTARAPLPPREAAAVVEQVARAVGYAHGRGVVHRDLKPDNILLAADGSPKVADFGLAKRLDVGTGLTATGAVMGTPAYMAPEQAAGEAKRVGPPADVWALGAILYRLLTGRPPFTGATPLDTLRRVTAAAVRPPGREQPGVPRALDTICLKCLQKDPAARYLTATELADDLRRWLDGQAVAARLPWRWRAGALAVGLLAVLAGGMWVASRPARTPAGLPAVGEQIEAVAVLPFVNGDQQPESDPPADGLSEAVINSLSAVRSLKVRPLSAVAPYRGQSPEPKAVADALGVQAVLIGRLTRQGDRVVVSAELIDARHNARLWGQRFDRPAADLSTLPGEISGPVAAALGLRLSPDLQQRVTRRYTASPLAFDLYQKGRRHFNTGTSDRDTRLAIAAYRQAAEADPGYALPHAALAEAYYWLSNNYEPPTAVIPPAKQAVAHALTLDDTLGDAHALAGLFAAVYDWDWPAAEAAFARARELSPGSPSVHQYAAIYLTAVGRHADALEAVRLARERDPTSSFLNAYPVLNLYLAGRYDEAITQGRTLIEVDPKNGLARAYLGLAYERKGDHPAAVAAFEAVTRQDPDNMESKGQLGYVLARASRRAEAETILNALLTERAHFVPAYNIAILYAGLGDTGKALDWLDRAVDDHSEWLSMVNTDPRTEPLRDHPRFQQLLRRLRLVP